MQLQVLGAGQDIGRSCFVLTIGPHRLLLDVGAHHGFDDARRFPDFAALPPTTLSSLTAVLVSHFHFDHVAALPLLTELHGCPAPVYMTAPTRHLARLLLNDVVATSASRAQECPYSASDVEASLSRARDLPVATPVPLAPGLSVTAYNAGHALGAVMLHIRTPTRSLLYSGDYASRPDRHLRPARLPFRLRPDVFISETTYASAARAPADPAAPLAAAVRAAVRRRARILIPVSAFGRVPAVLAALEACAGRAALQGVPLYVAAGLAWRALGAYAKHADEWAARGASDGDCAQCRSDDGDAAMGEPPAKAEAPARRRKRRRSRFADEAPDADAATPDGMSPGQADADAGMEAGKANAQGGETDKGKEKKRAKCPHSLLSRLRPFYRDEHWESVVRGPGPVVLFATPGGMATGLSRDVAREWAGDASNLIVVPGTCFKSAVASNALTGVQRAMTVRCQLVNLALQCHVDGPEIVRMVRHIAPKCVVLVHGEKARALGFRKRVVEELGLPCFAPANGDVLQLDERLLGDSTNWGDAARDEAVAEDGTVGEEDMDDDDDDDDDEDEGQQHAAVKEESRTEWDKALAKYRQMVQDVR